MVHAKYNQAKNSKGKTIHLFLAHKNFLLFLLFHVPMSQTAEQTQDMPTVT
jgi:hypothetical protein